MVYNFNKLICRYTGSGLILGDAPALEFLLPQNSTGIYVDVLFRQVFGNCDWFYYGWLFYCWFMYPVFYWHLLFFIEDLLSHALRSFDERWYRNIVNKRMKEHISPHPTPRVRIGEALLFHKNHKYWMNINDNQLSPKKEKNLGILFCFWYTFVKNNRCNESTCSTILSIFTKKKFPLVSVGLTPGYISLALPPNVCTWLRHGSPLNPWL